MVKNASLQWFIAALCSLAFGLMIGTVTLYFLDNNPMSQTAAPKSHLATLSDQAVACPNIADINDAQSRLYNANDNLLNTMRKVEFLAKRKCVTLRPQRLIVEKTDHQAACVQRFGKRDETCLWVARSFDEKSAAQR